MARYSACMATTTADSCTQQGGTWMMANGTQHCSCATGQDGCPCTQQSDCLAGCVVTGGAVPVSSNACADVRTLVCFPVGGQSTCYCPAGATYPICSG
jgi:hypothetical protein